jgi:hypothetical protein
MRDTTDLFLRAARAKFRFPSKVGDLTVEQLWDLPLTTTRGPTDLDTVAKAINGELKAASEESFVATTKNPNRGTLEAKLDIVKMIIATKQDDAREAETRASKAERRRLIEDAIAQAEVKELTNASKDDLVRRLRELEAEEA